jgi:hypothetical protein
MSISFQVKPHATRPDEQMVEVWRDGTFIAGIYPGNPQSVGEDGNSISIVSKYLAGGWLNEEGPPKLVAHFRD